MGSYWENWMFILMQWTRYTIILDYTTVVCQWKLMSRNVRKCTFADTRPAKIQISLRIRAVWSESSLGAFWIAKDATFFHADNEDSNQAAWICSWFESSLVALVKGYVFWRCGSNIKHMSYNSLLLFWRTMIIGDTKRLNSIPLVTQYPLIF